MGVSESFLHLAKLCFLHITRFIKENDNLLICIDIISPMKIKKEQCLQEKRKFTMGLKILYNGNR